MMMLRSGEGMCCAGGEKEQEQRSAEERKG